MILGQYGGKENEDIRLFNLALKMLNMTREELKQLYELNRKKEIQLEQKEKEQRQFN